MKSFPDFFQVLLTGDPASPEYRRAQARLERQPELQPLLEKLALGDTPWWETARELLLDSKAEPARVLPNSSVVIEVDSTLHGVEGSDSRAAVDVECVALDFLQPPAHPELLGRFDRYDVERVLGTGGMGVVLRAFDSELHRVVAIKILARHLANSSSARGRFAREAKAAAAVVHPNVIPIYNVGTEAKVPYLVMQFVAGPSLQRRVDEHGPLPVEDVLRIGAQTAAGLAAAHQQGLVHRDVKPANILLEEQVDRVLLSDFGLARTVDEASLTKTGIVAGTPDYMSPEQAFGEAIDSRSDLFSLGSVLYFMLTGRPPFRASGALAVLHRICSTEAHPLRDINPNVPVELEQLVERCLAKQADQRFQSADEVEAGLTDLLARYQRGMLRLSVPRFSVPSRAATALLSLAAIILLTVVAAGSGWWIRSAANPDELLKEHTEPGWFAQRQQRVEMEQRLNGGAQSLADLPPDDFYQRLLQVEREVQSLQQMDRGYEYQDEFETKVGVLHGALEQLNND